MKILMSLTPAVDPNLLVGMDTWDDAAVYRLTPDLALVQTVDIITPVVDDPFVFGQIAAANALSDVYAMGGRPLTAMNILAVEACVDPSIPREILRGAEAKIKESGAVVVGGHSVDDQELKFGLSVTGLVHPDKILRNSLARPGDVLILTKPIGTGIIATAIKGGVVSPEALEKAIKSMTALNREASEAALDFGAHAATDITGFGLIGHAFEMVRFGKIKARIFAGKVPILPGVKDLIKEGMVPGGTKRNQDHFGSQVRVDSGVSEEQKLILFDPQTSGGLLIAISVESSSKLIEKLGKYLAVIVGDIREGKGELEVVPGG